MKALPPSPQFACWQIVLKDFGSELDEKIHQAIIGLRLDKSAKLIKSSLGLSVDASELVRLKRKVFNRLLGQEIPVMPGLEKLIERMSDAGIPWAVATSSPRQYTRDLLRHIL